MRRMISPQTPISLTHLIYQAAEMNVEQAVVLVADVVFYVVAHGADQNDVRFDALLDGIVAKVRDQRPK